MLSTYGAILSKNSSTTSFQTTSIGQARCYRYGRSARIPCELQYNEKDRDIWNENGDCIVYLDDSSAISTAFRISASVLYKSNATFLLKNTQPLPRAQSPRSCDGSDSGYESTTHGPQEIHIDVPVGLSADEIVNYHVTTRNYFACLLDKPVIGSSLGVAIRDVWQRIQRWHSSESSLEFVLRYCESQGYLDFTSKPLNATAMLAFAEAARDRSLWINAFAHCVAMQDRITLESEYSLLSNTTKALMTKAALELEIHIPRALKSVSTFLESELSIENLGLSKPARDHLDQFRGFLYCFFADKLGQWPLPETDVLNKAQLRDIHDDFQSLYDYLVDVESSNDTLGDRGVIGGVCVHQNVDVFNQRHHLQALPHSLPLLPELTPQKRTSELQSGVVRGFKLMRVESEFRPSIRQALADASNSDSSSLIERPIVQDFIDFENQRLEDKLTIAEARKVRWLLIYCTLQMLKSLVMAPSEVTGANSAPYPLCVDVTYCPFSAQAKIHSRTHSVASMQSGLLLAIPTMEDDADRISIHPDCEADNARDFFAGRRSSVAEKSEDEDTMTRTTASPVSRTLSIRTSVSSSMTALQRSVIGSLSRKNSSRRSTMLVPKKMPSLQDIGVEEETKAEVEADQMEFQIGRSSPMTMQRPSDIAIPTLEDYQLDMLTSAEHAPLLDEQMSPISDTSRRDSMHSECETPPTEPSSRSNSYRESKMMGALAPLEEDSVLITRDKWHRAVFHPSASTSSLSAGCYTPSGLTTHEAPTSRFAAPQRRHVYERRQDRADSDSAPSSPLREKPRPLHNRYGRARPNTSDERRYTWGDLP